MTAQPVVEVYPVCDRCETPWALRMNLLNGEWIWTRDCKHREKSGLPLMRRVSDPGADT